MVLSVRQLSEVFGRMEVLNRYQFGTFISKTAVYTADVLPFRKKLWQEISSFISGLFLILIFNVILVLRGKNDGNSPTGIL